MISFIVLLLVVPFALILLWQLKTLRHAKRREGQMAPNTNAVDAGIGMSNRVYFFHATHCGPCRSVMPLVDRLDQNHPNLIKVGVAVYPELARYFGIAATPNFITVAEGRIREVKLGARSESWLRARLESET